VYWVWLTEQGFPQITEVFPLQALIGTTPQGTVFQCAFCLLLYNLLQLVRAHIAAAQTRPVPAISLDFRFEDVHRQVIALSELVAPPVVGAVFEASLDERVVRRRLEQLLTPVWTSRWLKAPPQKRKLPPTPSTSVGNHTSVYRLLEAYRRGA
jgi:hypothetical protein